jgi:hypothetical protein
MATKQLPSPELLRKLLRYEPETGKLFWRARPPDMFPEGHRSKECYAYIWNTRYANKEAFTYKGETGYLTGRVFNIGLQAHRVILAMENGYWPTFNVDHIDRSRHNNRLPNLREATHSENARNCSSAANSSSRFLGVSFYKRDQKWEATIRVDGRPTFLGRYACEIEAAKAYDAVARSVHGPYANLNFPEP